MFILRATYLLHAARSRAVPIALVVSLGLAGCAGSNTTAVQASSTVTPVHSSSRTPAATAAIIAEDQVGVPYRYGGANRSGFDCSGLVYFAYAHAGTQVARTTGGLWDTLQPVPKSDLRAGDILFFNIAGKMSHVGLYLGRGRFVHAPSTGRTVSIETLNADFYRRAFIRGGRVE